jgi:hypothetical protein
MIVDVNVPSSSTPTLVLAAPAAGYRDWVAITNHGDATVYYSIDGTANVTVANGVRAGIPLVPGATHFFTRSTGSPSSNFGPVYVVQTSGASQEVSVQYLP